MKLKELLDADFLWKVLVYVLCACVIIHGLRLNWVEKRVDALQEAFLEMSKNNVENTLKITTETIDLLKELPVNVIVIEKNVIKSEGENNGKDEDTSN